MTFQEAKAEALKIVKRFGSKAFMILNYELNINELGKETPSTRIIYFDSRGDCRTVSGTSWRECLDNLWFDAKASFDGSRPVPGPDEAPGDTEPNPFEKYVGPPWNVRLDLPGLGDPEPPAPIAEPAAGEDFGVRDTDFLKEPAERGTGIAPGFSVMPCPDYNFQKHPENGTGETILNPRGPYEKLGEPIKTAGEGSRIDPKTDPTVSQNSTGSLQETPSPHSGDPEFDFPKDCASCPDKIKIPCACSYGGNYCRSKFKKVQSETIS